MNEMYYVETAESGEAQTKNEQILGELLPFIYNLLEKMRTETREVVKALNPVAQVRNKLTSILRRYMPLTTTQMHKLEAETVWSMFCNYLDLIQAINEHLPYTADKLEMCAYACITTSYYDEQLNDTTMSANESQLSMHDVFLHINDTLIESTLAGAESGVLDAKTAQLRARARKYGHSVTATDDINGLVEQTAEVLTAASYAQKLEAAARNRPKIDE